LSPSGLFDVEAPDPLVLPLVPPEDAAAPLEFLPTEGVDVSTCCDGPAADALIVEVALAPLAADPPTCAATMRGRSVSRGVAAVSKDAANADSVKDAASAAVTPITVIHRRMPRPRSYRYRGGAIGLWLAPAPPLCSAAVRRT